MAVQNQTNLDCVDKLQLNSDLVVLLFVTRMFHIQQQIYGPLSLAPDASVGLPPCLSLNYRSGL